VDTRGTAWQRQPQPLAAVLEANLTAGPSSQSSPSGPAATLLSQAPTGSARLQLKPATLGGVAVSADVSYERSAAGAPQLRAELLAGANQLRIGAHIENCGSSNYNG
ncbi:hypothetical protein ACVBEH_28260, partial [Roseateles sp. GG27B]